MLTVDHYAEIRRRRRAGETVGRIPDELHHSYKTVVKALTNSAPAPPVD